MKRDYGWLNYALYILPIMGMFVGGCVAYISLRKQNRELGKNCLYCGVLWPFVLGAVSIFVSIVYFWVLLPIFAVVTIVAVERREEIIAAVNKLFERIENMEKREPS